MLAEYYRGKTLLISGTTGFLGKIILEKLLYLYPEIKQIFLLIRPRRDSTIYDRFKKEILDIPCFNRLRKKYGRNFEAFVNEKVKPIAGDLLEDKLGMSPEVIATLEEECQIIINSAASIDFTARVDRNIDINVHGPMRVLEMARRFKKLELFNQISTAYVNSDKTGWIEEKIYDYPDPEETLKYIKSIPEEKLEEVTPKLLGKFPNTYTYTKNIAERMLQKYRGNIPLVVVRPSIVGCSLYDPEPGWTDSIDAAGSLILCCGLGLIKRIRGIRANRGDIVPADTVIDTIIVANAVYANKNQFDVVHSCVSGLNPYPWNLVEVEVLRFWKANPSKHQVTRTIKWEMIDNKKLFDFKNLLMDQIPARLYLKAAQLMNNKKMIQQAEKLKRLVVDRAGYISALYQHFFLNEMIYSGKNADNLLNYLSEDERKQFPALNIRKIDFAHYFRVFTYGMRTFVLKEDTEFPSAETYSNDIVGKYMETYLFSDIVWAYRRGKNRFYIRHRDEVHSAIFKSKAVQKAIEQKAQAKTQKYSGRRNSQSFEVYRKEIEGDTHGLIMKMVSNMNRSAMSSAAWAFNKVWKRMYERIVIPKEKIDFLKQLSRDKHPLILLPTHKSYMDFMLISYIFYAHELKTPHIQAPPSFLKIMMINRILRLAGAFFLAEDPSKDVVYEAVCREYIKLLLKDNASVEMFLEPSRSRTGKIQAPEDQFCFKMAMDAFYNDDIQDAVVVPLTINYERVYEGETFPLELLGETKVQESFSRVMASMKHVSMNMGRVYVNYDKTFKLSSYLSELKERNVILVDEKKMLGTEIRETVTQSLIREVYNEWTSNLAVMPTSMVASLLLMTRRGMSEEELIQRLDWLRGELSVRGANLMGIEQGYVHAAVENAVELLRKSFLTQQKNIFENSVSAKLDYENILMLNYYKNGLMHHFWEEAVLICSFVSFSKIQMWDEGIPFEKAYDRTVFLFNMMKEETVYGYKCQPMAEYKEQLQSMSRAGNLLYDEEKGLIKLIKEKEMLYSYLCSLVWPTLESYYLAAVFLYSMKFKQCTYTEKSFLDQLQSFAQTMHEERATEYYEACSSISIKNAMKVFEQWGLISRSSSVNPNSLRQHQWMSLSEDYINSSKLHELIENIENYRKPSFASILNFQGDLRKAVIADYPFLGRLQACSSRSFLLLGNE